MIEYQAGTDIAIVGTLSEIIDDVTTPIENLEDIEIGALVKNQSNNIEKFYTNRIDLPKDGNMAVASGAYSFVITKEQSAYLVGDNYIEIAVRRSGSSLKIGSTRIKKYFTIKGNSIHKRF